MPCRFLQRLPWHQMYICCRAGMICCCPDSILSRYMGACRKVTHAQLTSALDSHRVVTPRISLLLVSLCPPSQPFAFIYIFWMRLWSAVAAGSVWFGCHGNQRQCRENNQIHKIYWWQWRKLYSSTLSLLHIESDLTEKVKAKEIRETNIKVRLG